jgi:hypothetical protein
MSENPLDQLIKAVYSCPNLLPKVYEDYLENQLQVEQIIKQNTKYFKTDDQSGLNLTVEGNKYAEELNIPKEEIYKIREGVGVENKKVLRKMASRFPSSRQSQLGQQIASSLLSEEQSPEQVADKIAFDEKLYKSVIRALSSDKQVSEQLQKLVDFTKAVSNLATYKLQAGRENSNIEVQYSNEKEFFEIVKGLDKITGYNRIGSSPSITQGNPRDLGGQQVVCSLKKLVEDLSGGIQSGFSASFKEGAPPFPMEDLLKANLGVNNGAEFAKDFVNNTMNVRLIGGKGDNSRILEQLSERLPAVVGDFKKHLPAEDYQKFVEGTISLLDGKVTLLDDEKLFDKESPLVEDLTKVHVSLGNGAEFAKDFVKNRTDIEPKSAKGEDNDCIPEQLSERLRWVVKAFEQHLPEDDYQKFVKGTMEDLLKANLDVNNGAEFAKNFVRNIMGIERIGAKGETNEVILRQLSERLPAVVEDFKTHLPKDDYQKFVEGTISLLDEKKQLFRKEHFKGDIIEKVTKLQKIINPMYRDTQNPLFKDISELQNLFKNLFGGKGD